MNSSIERNKNNLFSFSSDSEPETPEKKTPMPKTPATKKAPAAKKAPVAKKPAVKKAPAKKPAAKKTPATSSEHSENDRSSSLDPKILAGVGAAAVGGFVLYQLSRSSAPSGSAGAKLPQTPASPKTIVLPKQNISPNITPSSTQAIGIAKQIVNDTPGADPIAGPRKSKIVNPPNW